MKDVDAKERKFLNFNPPSSISSLVMLVLKPKKT